MSSRALPPSWADKPVVHDWGDTGSGVLEDSEVVKVWDTAPAPSAVEVSNRREPEPIEVGRPLSDFKAMERDALNKMHAEARAALESAERVLEGLNLLRAATQNHRQLVTGLRDLVETIEGMRSVFNRTLDRDNPTL